MSTVLVTGGSRGIGFGICEAFVKKGFNVCFTCRSEENRNRAEEYLNEIAIDSMVEGVVCDSGHYDQVETCVKHVIEKFGGIDVLVNNAGVRKYGSVDEIDVEAWDEAVATNINGYFYFCKIALPFLRKSRNPWIFNIGSTAANFAFAGGISYNTTKSAVHGMSESLQLDVRNDGVRVCNVVPGNVYNKSAPCPSDDEWMMRPIDIGESIAAVVHLRQQTQISVLEIKPTFSPDHPDKGIRALRYV